MFGMFGKRRGAQDFPPVVVPETSIRPGEDDQALVRALRDYVEAMRAEGAYALGELDPDALRAYAADRYIGLVSGGGHAAYLADRVPASVLGFAQEGLERILPDPIPSLHATAIEQMAKRRAAKPDVPVEDAADLLSKLDGRFAEAGGREALDPMLAGWIARLDGLEIAPSSRYADRILELCAANPEAAERRRDLAIDGFQRRLATPFEAGIAIVLARTTGMVRPFDLTPAGTAPRDDGKVTIQWAVETEEELFLAMEYSDRLVVFRQKPNGEGFAGLGNLGHDRIRLARAWAAKGNVALAAVLGLEQLGVADRLRAIVFDKRKTLRKSGAEAAAFHLALEEMRDLALVVFPKVSAVVDPRTNERLAEFEHKALAAEAEALAARLAALET